MAAATETSTASIDFRLGWTDHFKRGTSVCSPLQKLGGGYACLRVFPRGTLEQGVSAFVVFVPNVLWCNKWKVLNAAYSITWVNVDAARSIVHEDVFTFEMKGSEPLDRGWNAVVKSGTLVELQQEGWLTDDGDLLFQASLTGVFGAEQPLQDNLPASARMWLTRKLADMTVSSEDGEEIACHRNVLATVSPVFDRMLASSMSEGRDATVVIRDVCGTTLHIFITYLYTNKLPFFADYITLLRLADMYEVPDLSKECMGAISETVNEATIGAALHAVQRHRKCFGAAECLEGITKRAREDEAMMCAVAKDFLLESKGKLLARVFADKNCGCEVGKTVLSFLRGGLSTLAD